MNKNQDLKNEQVSVFFRILFACFCCTALYFAYTAYNNFSTKNADILYILFYVFAAVSIVSVTGYVYFNAEKLPYEKQFALLFFTFGVLYLMTMPSWATADGIRHWYRILDISEGHIIAEINTDRNQVGGWLPENADPDFDIINPFYAPEHNYIKYFSYYNAHLNDSNLVWYSFAGISLYSPMAYAFQLPGTFLSMLVTDRPFVISFAARISAFLLSFFLLFVSIKYIPVKQRTFLFLTLTPMFLDKTTSLAADALLNAIAFAIVASALYFASDKITKLKRVHLLTICLLTVTVALTKIVYLPLVALFWIIPSYKYPSRKRFYIFWASLLSVSILANLAWTLSVQPFLDYDIFSGGKGLSKLQVRYMLLYPIESLWRIVTFYYYWRQWYFDSFWGVSIGAFQVYLGDIVYLAAYAVFVVTLTDNLKVKGDKVKKRSFLFIGVACLILILIMAALMIQMAFNLRSLGRFPFMVQGRYFIPVSIVLAVCIPSILPLLKRFNTQNTKLAIYRVSLLAVAIVQLSAIASIMITHI